MLQRYHFFFIPQIFFSSRQANPLRPPDAPPSVAEERKKRVKRGEKGERFYSLIMWQLCPGNFGAFSHFFSTFFPLFRADVKSFCISVLHPSLNIFPVVWQKSRIFVVSKHHIYSI